MMHSRTTPTVSSLLLTLTLLVAAGCASSKPSGEAPATAPKLTKEAVLLQDDVKGKPPTVFNQPLDKVHQAALRTLTAVGAEVKVNEPYHVAGKRPNKFGLFVGSGGETVEMFLYPASEGVTHVWFDTDLSFVGMAGQQGWEDQMKKELTAFLAQ